MMTDHTFQSARKRLSIIPPISAVAMLAVLAGCASGPVEAMQSGPQPGAIDTGTYPNLNVPPQSAATPISDEDKAGLTGRLASAKARQGSAGRGVGTAGDPNRLKRLAQQHGPDTLKAIEAQ